MGVLLTLCSVMSFSHTAKLHKDRDMALKPAWTSPVGCAPLHANLLVQLVRLQTNIPSQG